MFSLGIYYNVLASFFNRDDIILNFKFSKLHLYYNFSLAFSPGSSIHSIILATLLYNLVLLRVVHVNNISIISIIKNIFKFSFLIDQYAFAQH